MDVNVTPFEIETKTRHGDMVRADVYLPRNSAGPFPVLLGASPYQKSLRNLPPVPATFPFSSISMRATPMSRWTHRAWANPKGCGTPFRAPRARRFTR